MTKPSALEGIILRGIVPGGNDSARRLAAHFGVFAPWDSENISTKTAMHDSKEGDDLSAIYVPTRKLSVYQSGVTSGGTIVAFKLGGSTPTPSRARSVQDSRTLRA